jgi:hypothetical protein
MARFTSREVEPELERRGPGAPHAGLAVRHQRLLQGASALAVGFEKVLTSRLIARAELTRAYAFNDYGVVVSYVPAVSLSIPLGRYSSSAR